MRSGGFDDVPLQNNSVAIRRVVHRGFAVARVRVGQAGLVPVGAHGHRQPMLDGKAITAFPACEIGIFEKSREERRSR
jgi:hypothetical protein